MTPCSLDEVIEDQAKAEAKRPHSTHHGQGMRWSTAGDEVLCSAGQGFLALCEKWLKPQDHPDTPSVQDGMSSWQDLMHTPKVQNNVALTSLHYLTPPHYNGHGQADI